MLGYRCYDAGHVGVIPNPRLCLSVENGVACYSFQVFFKVINAGVCADDLSNVDCLMEQLSMTSGFVVCPGIREYPASIRFTTKNLVVWNEPFKRQFSTNCVQRHIPNNAKQTPDSMGFNCCKPCKQLIHDIRQLQQKTEKISTPIRTSRHSAGSNYPISKLSPASQSTRLAKKDEQRKQSIKKLKKLDKFTCDVGDKQHAEILQLVSSVKDSKAVQELLAEGDCVLGEQHNALRQAWQQDVHERLDYEKDQHKAGAYTTT